MGMQVTISGTSSRYQLADLDVSGLKFVFQNQDDDYAEVKFKRDWKGSFPEPFSVGTSLVFMDPAVGIRRFRGTVAEPRRTASGVSRSQSVVIKGPWAQFKERMFTYSYPYVNGNSTTTHGVIGGQINGLVATILTTNCSDLVAIGTIDLGSLIVPTSDVYDQTVAQVLKNVLRLVPGAVAAIDYSTTPLPTIHVLADNSANLQSVSIDVSAGTSRDVSIIPRYDRQIQGVWLYYESSRSIRSAQYAPYQDGAGATVNTASSPVVENSGFYLVGSETAGDTSSSRTFRRTIRLSGVYETTTYTLRGQIFNRSLYQLVNGLSPGVTGPAVDLTVYGSFFRVFAAPSTFSLRQADIYTYINSPGLKGSVSATPYANTNFRPFYALGPSYASWVDGSISSIPKSPAIAANSIPGIFLFTPGISLMSVDLEWNSYYNIVTSAWENYKATVAFVNPDNFTNGVFSKTVNTSTVPERPNIAYQLFLANNRLLHDGSLTVGAADPLDLFAGRRRKAVLSPVAVTTPIQRVVVDYYRKTAECTFGAPEHLGPQDLIALAKAASGV